MVHWVLIPIALFVGVCMGIVLLAFIEAGEEEKENENERRWYDG